MKSMLKTLGVTIGLSALMAGCAVKPYVPTLYDSSTANVRTVALADDSMPEKLGANELASHLGTGQAAGGLIGALVVAGMEAAETSSRENALAEIMDPMEIDWEDEFETILIAKLADAGFGNVDIASVTDRKGPLKAVPDTTSDAVLDVQMSSFGIQKAQTGQEWRPAAGINVQLLRAGTGELLMENVISYNSGVTRIANKEGGITLYPPASSTGFMKVKEIDPDVLAADMRVMLDEIATTIVSLLEAAPAVDA